MTKTKIGEQGLKDEDIKERDKLSQKLVEAFSDVEDYIGEINDWLEDMRGKFRTYYGDRSKDWQQSKGGASSVYDSFTDEWDNFKEPEGFEEKLVEMRDLLETWVASLKDLPKEPSRRTKVPKAQLFTRKLQKSTTSKP